MAQVTARNSLAIAAPPERVAAALADYRAVRPKIAPDPYLDYRVLEGGQGAGTVVHWILKASEARSRDVVADVTTTDDALIETDRNSSMVTEYRIAPRGTGSLVTVTSTWDGGGGISGFAERLFAPVGLKKIQGLLLNNLRRYLTTDVPAASGDDSTN